MPWRVAGQCPNINITTTVTWDYPVSVDEFYTVKSGGQLIITAAAVVTFYQSCAGIRVETGGYLIVENNARLTSDGSGTYLWAGIEIQAHNSNPSASFSNCTIEHAQVGVKMTTTHINLAYYGPCANFTNCSFLNNKVGIYYWGFTTVSPGCSGNNITNCTFAINSSVPSAVTNPVRFIEMSSANYLNITGTTFQDVLYNNIDVQGINKQLGGALEISGCTFNGVDKGIYLQSSTSSDRILNNTFTNIPAISFTPCCGGYQWGTNYGLFTVGSNRYRAEGNSFTGTSRLNVSKLYGIVTDNSGSAGALMFKNTFTNTSTAFQSQNNNSNYAVSCNTFTNYIYDFSRGSAWYTYNGSLRTQGNNNCSNSNQRAGNEWTSACNNSSAVDIKVNSASYFHYFGHFLDQAGGDNTRPECSTTAWEPTYVVANYCGLGTAGYQKTSTACNTPFYTCTGCRLAGNDLGIEPQLLNALDYYRNIADSVNAESETIGSQYALEQSAHYLGLAQLVSNEIAAQLMDKSVDTAILYLESSDLLEDKKTLAEFYLSAGRYEDCHKVVDNVESATGWRKIESANETVRAEYTSENSAYVELMQLLLSIYESGRRLDKCTDEEIAALEQLSNSTTLIGPKACAYLKAATGKECSYEIYADDEDVEKRLASPAEDFLISLYPNPASSFITLEVNIPNTITQPEYDIYDVAGRQVSKGELHQGINEVLIDTKNFPEGTYILQLRNLNAVIEVRKFSITK